MTTRLVPYLAGILLAAFMTAPAADDRNNDVLFNQVHMEASAERDVENDRLDVTLAVEVQGKEPGRIAAQVNEVMDWALKKVRSAADIEAQTGTYQTHPVYRDQVVIAWRARQQLLLNSKEITELSQLVGELQDRLQVKQMQFSVSPEARREAENALISEAMQAFKQRVSTVQEHMDGSDYRIVNLHINTGRSSPVMYQERAMAMSARDAAAPAVESGTSRVTVTINGSVQFY
ncbi:MAG: SIMPL domain-containing protein [Gammaproteobacteria bacterium]